MKILDLLDSKHVLTDLKAEEQEGALKEMAGKIAGELDVKPDKLVKALMERETTRPTALESTGVAIPHARLSGIKDFLVLFARSSRGIDFKAEDGQPCHLFFLIVGPEDEPGNYLRLLARIARICHDKEFREKLMKASDSKEILDMIAEQDSKY